MKLVALLAVIASCGFPRPPDVAPGDGAPGDGAPGCVLDEDCSDPSRPLCVSGQCFAPSEACSAGGGARIVYISSRDGNPEVFRAYANGSTPVQLTHYDPPQATSVVVPSPDGKTLAFIHESDVFMMTVDGNGPINLTSSAVLDANMEWSPDGKWLAVATTNASSTPGAYFMKADGTGMAALVGDGTPARDPSWWPDSSKVVFASASSAETDIWATPVSPPGQGATKLIPLMAPGESFSEPRVAPSAIAVALLLAAQGGDPSALIVPTFGGMGEPLTTGAIADRDIVWSHDSSKLAVVRGNGTDRAIWVVRPDGSGLTNLTPGSHPRWSPDDRAILFDPTRDGNREVYRMNSDGSNQVDLSNTPFDDFGGEWLSCAQQ